MSPHWQSLVRGELSVYRPGPVLSPPVRLLQLQLQHRAASHLALHTHIPPQSRHCDHDLSPGPPHQEDDQYEKEDQNPGVAEKYSEH